MHAHEVDVACTLIAAAMNAAEAAWAKQTFDFHFKCKDHGLDDGRVYFTSYSEARMQALAGLHHYAWGPPENVWLAWFAVHPDHQRQGVGSHLLESLETLARARSYGKLFIETYDHPDFDKARRFYEARGFRLAGGVSGYLSGGEDMVVYTKALT